jgi:hypothetical protein
MSRRGVPEAAMSFTFDDIGRNVSVKKSVTLDRLNQRIEQLRSGGGSNPEINARIAALEHRRQQLVSKESYGLKAPELEPRSAEDMGGRGGSAENAIAGIQQRADRGFTRVSAGRNRFQIR